MTSDHPAGGCSNWIPVLSGCLRLKLDDSRADSKVGELTGCQEAGQSIQVTCVNYPKHE